MPGSWLEINNITMQTFKTTLVAAGICVVLWTASMAIIMLPLIISDGLLNSWW